jgi:hypothetical protein
MLPVETEVAEDAMISPSLIALTGLVLNALVPDVGEERIPAFARLHRVSCAVCHDPIPRLTAFGETFAGNGFRFAQDQPSPDRVPTGDPLLELPGLLRLAMRLDAYTTAYANGSAAADLQAPYNLKVMSGGPLSESLSYYLYFLLFERGEIGGIEDAFVSWNDLAGAPVDVSVGQFQVSDPMFKRELRLTYEDYAVYRARIGNTPADLTYDRGLVVSADAAGFTLTAQVVNGNGKEAALASRRFDDDRNKSFIGHLRRDLLPGVSLGLLGYVTRQEGAAPGGPSLLNKLWMLGGDATIQLGPVEVSGQFVHREDTRPTFTLNEPTAVTNGGFGQVLLHPAGTRWYAIALYNVIEVNRPLLDVRLGGAADVSRYETVTGGGGYVLRRNVRVYAEGTWNRELGATQWTVGLTTAF